MAIKLFLNGTVHSRERKRLYSNLVVQLRLYLELEIRHACYDFFHFRTEQQRQSSQVLLRNPWCNINALRLRKLRRKLPHGYLAKHGGQNGGRKRPGCLATNARWPVSWAYPDFISFWIVSFLNNFANNSRIAILIWTKMSKRGGNCTYLLVFSRSLGYWIRFLWLC